MKSLFKHLRTSAQYPQKPVSAGSRIQTILSSSHSAIPFALNLLIFLPVLLTFRPTPVKAVLGTGSFGQRYSADLRGDIVLIGNTLTTCTSATACNNILNGTNTTGNNQTTGITAARVDLDSNTSTTNSSMAGLRLPAGSTVVRAYLYYQSSQAGTTQPPQDTQVLFGRTNPGVSATSSDYQTVTATAIENFSTSATRGFTAVADVTNIVNSLGSGDYWVGNLDGYTNLGSWSGWSLVVVFSNPTQNIRNLSVNDGSAIVGVLSNISSQDVTISGFKAPNTGIFDVKIGAVAYDGDRGSADNGYQINNINITDGQNSATDAFNSSITDMGAFYSPTWGRNPNHSNNLSIDIDLLLAPTPATIANGATTAKFTVASTTETLYLQALTTSIEIAAISGTLYRDNNNNGTFNTGEPTLPAGITVRLLNPADNSIIATTSTAADGTYTFTRINDGNYRVQVDTTDTDIPADLRLVTQNNLAVSIAGAPVNEQSFGFVPSADLSLSKTVNNASPNVGENITFTVTLNNAGPSSATGVSVADLLPAGLTFVSATQSQGLYSNTTGIWSVGSLASATNATLQITATVATAGAKTNTAQVSASAQSDPDSTPNNSVITEDDQASVTVTPPSTDLSIVKTDSPDPVIAGANLTYAIAVTNTGSTATNVVMSDPLPSGTTFQSITAPSGWNCTTPAVGINGTVSCTNTSMAVGTSNFTLVVRVDPNTANNASLSNTATVSSTTSDSNTSNNSSSQTTTVRQSADLRLTKVSTPASPNVGDTFEYTITVTNDGPSTATNVQVRDALPLGIGYVLNRPSQGTYDPIGTQVWNVGTLNSGASATLVIRAIRNSAANTVNTAEVIAADQSDPDSPHNNQVAGEDDQASVTVPNQSVDLAVTKTVNNSTPSVGQNVTFTITVANPAASTVTATNIGINDVLPQGLTYQSHNESTGTYNGTTGVWSVASLAPGTTATLTLVAQVTTSGAKINTAQLSTLDQSDPNANNNSSSATVTAATVPPSLILVKRITQVAGTPSSGFNDLTTGSKAADDNNANWPTPLATYLRGLFNGGSVAPGAEVEYTIYFLNNQNAATNVTICDPVPANMTFVSDGYNSASPRPTESGALPTDTGIALASNAATLPINPTFYLTNANDSDRGRYYPPNDPSTPNACKRVDATGNVTATGAAANTNGAIVVNVVSGTNQLPPATASGNPTNSYGYIRFKARVR